MDYVLSCCSPCDLTNAKLRELKVSVMHYKFTLSGKEFIDDGGESIPYAEFYQAMRDGAVTKTSQVNIEEFTEYFRNILKKEGKDILHVSMSSGISGTYNSARLAAESLKEEFPSLKIIVVDSLCISGGYGLLMELLSEKKDEGYTIEELKDYAEKTKLKIHHWFYSSDLTFYVKGGRISKVSGFIGSILKICPVMDVNRDGKLIPRVKTLGRKKALQTTLEKFASNAIDGVNYDGKCFINHSDCLQDAVSLKNLIEENFPALVGKIEIGDIGTTIGCHSGPGTVAVYFLGTERGA